MKNFLLKKIMLKNFVFALAVFCSLALAACLSDWEGDEGTFSISVGGGGARALDWPLNKEDIDRLEHTITVSGGPGSPRTAEKILSGQTVYFSVAPGTWDIFVEAYLGAEKVAAGSALGKKINPGRNGTIIITMEKADEQIPVTGVSLDKTSTSLLIGKSEKLIPTIAPATATTQTVRWSSSDETVATVSGNGTVTGVSAGTATITVTTDDGGKTASCTVTVSAATVAVTGVTLDESTLTLTVGNNATLTATVTPTDASNKNVTWATNNAAVATVSSNGTVTGIAAGTATITVTTEDGNKTASCIVTVLVKVELNFVYYWVDGNDDLVIDSDAGEVTVDSDGNVTITVQEVPTGDTITITAPGTGYVVKHWYVNDVDFGDNSTNPLTLSISSPRKYVVGLFVEKGNKLYNTTITINVVP
jgi:uncharacterized protein YjdB